MKNILILLIVAFTTYSLSAQWETTGNTLIVPGTDLLGTTDNSPIPLVTNNNIRMLIEGTPGGNGGKIGIGNNLATNFVPQQRLHLHQGNDNNDNFIRWSNGDIGNMRGLDIGLRAEYPLRSICNASK